MSGAVLSAVLFHHIGEDNQVRLNANAQIILFWDYSKTGLFTQGFSFLERRALKSIYSNEYQSLLAKLIAARKKRGITQQALADGLRRPQSYVSKIETGERRMDVIEFIHICAALALDPCKIIRATAKRA
jgi:DNA-binding XRE family transcriptional regulator